MAAVKVQNKIAKANYHPWSDFAFTTMILYMQVNLFHPVTIYVTLNRNVA